MFINIETIRKKNTYKFTEEKIGISVFNGFCEEIAKGAKMIKIQGDIFIVSNITKMSKY